MTARLGKIASLQRRICQLQAEQVSEVATFVDERNALDADLGVSLSPGQYRSMVAEVSIACNFSTMTAQSFVADAYDLALRHPFTHAALAKGTVNLPTARAVARETRLIDDADQQALADRVIAEELPHVPPGKIRGMVERRVIEIDPDAAARKAVTSARIGTCRFNRPPPAPHICRHTCQLSKPLPAGTPSTTTRAVCAPQATAGPSATSCATHSSNALPASPNQTT